MVLSSFHLCCGSCWKKAVNHFRTIRFPEKIRQRHIKVVADADDGVQVELAASGFRGGNRGGVDPAIYGKAGNTHVVARRELLDAGRRIEHIFHQMLPPRSQYWALGGL